jgi:hypothetical protein
VGLLLAELQGFGRGHRDKNETLETLEKLTKNGRPCQRFDLQHVRPLNTKNIFRKAENEAQACVFV